MNHIVSFYTKKYFLSDCEGYIQFNASKGKYLSPRLKRIFELGKINTNMRILDIGCGRGELLLQGALKGAYSYGIDNSNDALSIAKEMYSHYMKKNKEILNKITLMNAKCTLLPFKYGTFDIVFMSDIVEHLSNEDLQITLREVYNVLKDNGKLILHTSPNKIFKIYGLKLYSLIAKMNGIKTTWNLEKQLPPGLLKPIHVNEQTIFSLRRVLKSAGFTSINLWLEKNPHFIYYFFNSDVMIGKINFVMKFIPFKHLFYSEVYGIAEKGSCCR